jgi:hypothetical protein
VSASRLALRPIHWIMGLISLGQIISEGITFFSEVTVRDYILVTCGVRKGWQRRKKRGKKG